MSIAVKMRSPKGTLREVLIMTYAHLMNKKSDWHKNQDHRKIINEIETLPKEEQTSAILSLLARAFINIDHFSDAISTLTKIVSTV